MGRHQVQVYQVMLVSFQLSIQQHRCCTAVRLQLPAFHRYRLLHTLFRSSQTTVEYTLCGVALGITAFAALIIAHVSLLYLSKQSGIGWQRLVPVVTSNKIKIGVIFSLPDCRLESTYVLGVRQEEEDIYVIINSSSTSHDVWSTPLFIWQDVGRD